LSQPRVAPGERAPQSNSGTLNVVNPPATFAGGWSKRRRRLLFPREVSLSTEPARPQIRSEAALVQRPSALSGAVDVVDFEMLAVLIAMEF